MNTANINFMRQCRTPQSEGYLIRLEGKAIGRLDLHFGVESSYATLIMHRDFEETDILDLVCEIDDQLIISAETSREELYVTAYRGDEIGFFSDEHIDEHRSRRTGETNGAD